MLVFCRDRLHPLWPQHKLLQTPRTADYRHTRQDRWIQTELAFTLAKNATKPNPFEIIPLQTTRKENNWKTEEALARAAVTVETERIKGPNPWCLWWWWWFKEVVLKFFILFLRPNVHFYLAKFLRQYRYSPKSFRVLRICTVHISAYWLINAICAVIYCLWYQKVWRWPLWPKHVALYNLKSRYKVLIKSCIGLTK